MSDLNSRANKHTQTHFTGDIRSATLAVKALTAFLNPAKVPEITQSYTRACTTEIHQNVVVVFCLFDAAEDVWMCCLGIINVRQRPDAWLREG